MLRVHDHYKCVNPFSAGAVFIRQNLIPIGINIQKYMYQNIILFYFRLMHMFFFKNHCTGNILSEGLHAMTKLHVHKWF